MALEIQLLKEDGCDRVNRFNPPYFVLRPGFPTSYIVVL